MQYALIQLKGKAVLMSVHEVHALDTYRDDIAELAKPQEDALPFHLCYGSYMPQEGIGVEKAIDDFNMARDHFLGYVETNKCHLIAFHDAKAFKPHQVGKAIRIPFAALIQADDAILQQIGSKSTRSVAGFLRYADMSPATNILNRPGIIALKGLEKRLKSAAVKLDNWRDSIDPDRAIRAASSIK